MTEEVNLRILPREAASHKCIRKAISRKLSVKTDDINDIRIIRRSIDARQKQVMVNLTVRVALQDTKKVTVSYDPVVFPNVQEALHSVVIVGAGPAGLFAALKAIELGIKPIVLERGKDVDSRRLDLASLSRTQKVDNDSNYCFGEGGAGTFSDGKLFTRSKKRGNVQEILRLLHQHGAREEILIDSHPHIGSDRLPSIIKNIRKRIIDSGGEVRFQTKVTGLIISDDDVARGVETSTGEQFYGPVVLATGHSARDIYRMLHSKRIKLEPKGLAIGVRLEHPQHLIDSIQYHSPDGRGEWLPAAEYNFVCQVEGRGVYSFCMCPGGVIVPAVSGPDELVVNGMSASARASRWANSGMVVEIRPEDIPEYDPYGDLKMLVLQEELEQRFFEDSGHTLNAPAQRMTDFVAARKSESLPESSYLPGIHSARIDQLLPEFISRRLQAGFEAFGRKSKGFLTDKAILVGLESRTSSPVRIPRGENRCHVEITHLYPAGEGAGYAGGIVSAALDGQNAIIALAESIKISSDNKLTEKNGHNT